MSKKRVMQKRELLGIFRKQNYVKVCYHENADCSKDIIHAHSISNNRTLKSISHEGDVTTFIISGDDNPKLLALEPKGRRSTSVFTGFCGFHDKVFEPIDNHDYRPGDRKQEFLFAYRAAAREFQTKSHSLKQYELMLKIIRGEEEPDVRLQLKHVVGDAGIEKFIGLMYKGTKDSIEVMQRIRTGLNSNLDSGRFDRIRTRLIKLGGYFPVAVSSAFFIELDLEGNTINDLGTEPLGNVAPTLLTIVPQVNETFVLLSNLSRQERVFSFMSQLTGLPQSETRSLVSNIIAGHCENIAISPEFWKKLPSQARTRFENSFNETLMGWGQVPLIIDEGMNIFV